METIEADDDEHTHQLSVSWSTDGPYVRRGCPSCGLEFKTEVGAAQYASLLDPAIQRAGQEFGIHIEGDPVPDSEATTLTCPYCRIRIDAGKSHTMETWLYVRRLAYREIIAPMLRDLLSGFDGGLISISLSGPSSLPPRPIHGPEPPDMVAVHFLCCGNGAKLLPSWLGQVACPTCGEIVETW